MLKDSFSFIANYLWRESIKNLNKQLTEAELKNFSSNDYYYLTTIYYMGTPNFSQVAEALKLTKPAISVMIRKLTQMNFIEKVQSLEDKRVYYISVTKKGKSLIDGDEELYKNFDMQLKEILADHEKYTFVENLLEEIVHHMKNNNLGH